VVAEKSAIEWTESTWNPVTGCTKVSPGCAHCYAERIMRRFGLSGPFIPGLATIQLHPDRLEHPLRWRRPRFIFVNSMSDLFHPAVPDSFVAQVFDVMLRANWHVFQILTKRPERMQDWVNNWLRSAESAMSVLPSHIWTGTSVENQHWADRRIPLLEQTPAQIRFLSCEPLLGPLDLSIYLAKSQINWVIVGGESGPRARPMDLSWCRRIRSQCAEFGVPFFLKQLGGWPDKRGGNSALLDGRLWREMPDLSCPTLNALATPQASR